MGVLLCLLEGFARNTVDLLQNVRRLKALGIETQFLTANMTSMGNSEFVLTIFGALAQDSFRRICPTAFWLHWQLRLVFRPRSLSILAILAEP